MKKITPLFLTLLLTALACNWQIKQADPTPVPTGTPAVTATATIHPTPTQTALPTPPNALGITGNVYIRQSPNANDNELGILKIGDSVIAVCVGNWCRMTGGYIWRGCTDDNPNALGCEERR